MAVSLKHAFTSAVPDGGDTSLVQPSNWNAEHNLTMGTGALLGRTTAGTGAAEEITAGTGLTLSAGSLAVSVTTPQTNTSNTFTANQIIQVTDNTNAALRITQLGTGEAIRVEDSTNPDSTAFVVDASGALTTGGNATINGSISSGSINITGATTEAKSLEIGTGRTGDGNSFIDLVSDATYTDYGARIIRSPGANGATSIVTRGTGALALATTEAGALTFGTSGTTRQTIRSDGNIGMGGGGLANVTLNLAKTLTGSTSVTALYANGTIQPDATATDYYFATSAATAANGATPYTITGINHFGAIQGTFNADSTVTNQSGFNSAASLIGATNNYGFNAANTAAVTTGKTAYGFYSGVNTATGGGTTWGFYSGGTANNYFNGSVGIGTTTMTSKLNVSGDIYVPIASGIGTPRGSDNAFVRMLYMDTGTNTTVINGGYGSVSASSVGIAFKNTNGTTVGAIGAVGQIGVGGTGFGTSGQTIISAGSSSAPAWGTLGVAGGGTGATTLTGYVKGSGTSALTASATIPNTDITGLGTMSTQAASSVAITGGSITGITDLAVADGGTGLSSATAYALLAGGTTSTGAFQSLGTGTAGQVLTSNGASALPTWAAGPATPTLTSYTSGSGNWTIPSSGTFALVRAWGGGGSGGRGGATATNTGGGGGGGFSERLYRISDLGIAGGTVAYSVGAGGTAVSAAGAGNPGGNSTFSSGSTLLTAYGGGPGLGNVATAANNFGGGGGGALGAGANNVAGELGGGASAAGPTTVWGGGGGATAGTTTGGNGYLGGGGGGGANGATLRAAGTSALAGAGGAASNNGTAATSGTAPAGGGGGQSANAGSSGAGGAGRIEIWVW